MRKGFCFVLFFILSGTGLLAQIGELGTEQAQIIKKSKTYFVLDEEDSTEYNKSVVAAAKKFWKVSKYEFIKYSQVNEFIQNSNTTFVLKLIYSVNTNLGSGNWSYGFNPKTNKYEKSFKASSPGLSYRYDGIVLVSGGKKKG